MLLIFVYARRLIFFMLLLMYAPMKFCTVSTNGMRERERERVQLFLYHKKLQTSYT